MKTIFQRLCLCGVMIAICSGCSSTQQIGAEQSDVNSVESAEIASDHIEEKVTPVESDVVTIREQYPYVDTYDMAYHDPDMALSDCVDGASLIRFKIEKRLDDVVVETDMMAGIGMSDEELSFFENAGMRYMTTTYEQYAVRRTDTAPLSNEDDTITILHNTMFGEMSALFESGGEFAAFFNEDQVGLICNFETLYYLTDAETLLSVVDNPISEELDGLTWEQAVEIYTP